MNLFDPKYQLIEINEDTLNKVIDTFDSFIVFQKKILKDYDFVGFMTCTRKDNITFYREYSNIELIDNYTLTSSRQKLYKWFEERINNDEFDTIEIEAFGNGIRLTFGKLADFVKSNVLEEKIDYIKKNTDTVEMIDGNFTYLNEDGERITLVGEELKEVMFRLMNIKMELK